MPSYNILQISVTYGTRATLDTPDHFHWHEEALKLIVIGTLNYLKASRWHAVSKRLPTPGLFIMNINK